MASKNTTKSKVEETKTKKTPKKENTKTKSAPKAEIKETKKVTKPTEKKVADKENKSKKKTTEKVVKTETKKQPTMATVDLEKTTVYNTEEFTQKERDEQERLEKKAAKKSRRSEIIKEIRAFFILLISIGLICLGVWYWYTHYYNKDDNGIKHEKVEKQIAEYKTVKYSLTNEDSYLEVLNDTFIIERDEEYIYKVMDLKTEVLYEGKESFTHIYEGTDNKLYAYTESGLEYENVIELYVLKDGEFEKIKTLTSSSVSYHAILYKDELNNNYLSGFYGFYSGYNEEYETVNETRIYTIDGQEYSLNNIYLVGDNETTDELTDIVSYDKQYVIMYEIQNSKKKYGLYDIQNKKVIIKPQYEGLYTNGLNYIAIKNGKSGIITSKLKKIVDFTYDFVGREKDFYVVSKNNKLAIMNEDYKLVTDFVFDYQPSNKGIPYNYNSEEDERTFTANYLNNKYILSINNGEDKGLTYDKHETYIISEDGKYETIKTNKFFISPTSSLIYSYNVETKTYTIYDQELKKMYDINLTEYDYSNYPEIELVNENTLIIHINSDIYFNYETGEEIEKPLDYQTLINGVSINYKNNKVEYQVNKKVVAEISVDISEDNVYFKKINDNILYYNTKKDYVYIEKGE